MLTYDPGPLTAMYFVSPSANPAQPRGSGMRGIRLLLAGTHDVLDGPGRRGPRRGVELLALAERPRVEVHRDAVALKAVGGGDQGGRADVHVLRSHVPEGDGHGARGDGEDRGGAARGYGPRADFDRHPGLLTMGRW